MKSDIYYFAKKVPLNKMDRSSGRKYSKYIHARTNINLRSHYVTGIPRANFEG